MNAVPDSVAEPIQPTWKIRQVLDRYPALLATLLDISPRFAPLRRPLTRKVQSRLVTVEQAARIAGLEPATLVAALNHAAGLTVDLPPASPVAPAMASPVAWPDDVTIAAEVDARPMQARGEEPFSAIMAAIARVPVGQALRLRNTFEPTPLYEVLSKRGFLPRAIQHGPDDWELLFLNNGSVQRPPRARPAPPASPAAIPPRHDADSGATITLDVSELPPPEPLVKILETLETLPPGTTLLVRHARRPIHLYPRLDALGCRHETRDLGPGRVELRITRPVTPPEPAQ
ncbi:MAG: DUF2249 domain-containing protein [Thermomicrobiales bacterium]